MKQALIMLGIYVVIGLLTVGGLYLFVPPVQAAPVSDGVVFCTKTATTGPIDIWLCEPDLGPSFIINSVGFMQVVD